jgi:hypothetical protein
MPPLSSVFPSSWLALNAMRNNRQRFVRLDRHYLSVDSALVCAKIETVVRDRFDRPAE